MIYLFQLTVSTVYYSYNSIVSLPFLFVCFGKDPVQKITLAVSNLQHSVYYWSSLLGMKVMEKSEEKKTVLMGFTETQVGSLRALF